MSFFLLNSPLKLSTTTDYFEILSHHPPFNLALAFYFKVYLKLKENI